MRHAVLALLVLSACSSETASDPAETPEHPGLTTPGGVEFPAPATPSAADEALLGSRDCRTVAQGYFNALAARDFKLAARFWDDPVVDEARLQAVFHGYERPQIAITNLTEEGAAGSLMCVVTGRLADAADQARPASEGGVTLRRANDVPGATPEQLRWHVEVSTFAEPLKRSQRGQPG